MLVLRKSQNGVTLIELMIGLAIFAILLAFAVPNFSNFMQNSRIRNAAEAIQSGLNLARAEAVRRNTNINFVLGAGSGWTVECQTAVADVDGDNVPDCPGRAPTATTPIFIQTRAAAEGSTNAVVGASEVISSTGVAAAVPIFTSTLTFTSLGGVLNSALPVGNSAVFDITNPTGGNCASANGPMRCLRVVVTSGGQVRMCDPQLTISRPTDPQAC